MTPASHLTDVSPDNRVALYSADCLEVLKIVADASIDAVVCDPPYALNFMQSRWDRFSSCEFQQWCESWAAECLRVLKPGGHLVAFGGTRTWHRLTAGIEDAGFEIRDGVVWLYGGGMPKSLDVSKAIDKAAGAERMDRRVSCPQGNRVFRPTQRVENAGTPVTDAAKRWAGWGTTLKPAYEPIVLARKPFTGTVAANVLAHGTGALNIDAAGWP